MGGWLDSGSEAIKIGSFFFIFVAVNLDKNRECEVVESSQLNWRQHFRPKLEETLQEKWYETAQSAATYAAVFAEPFVRLGYGLTEQMTGQPVPLPVDVLCGLELGTSAVFAADFVANYLARGNSYLKTPEAIINALAVGMTGATLAGEHALENILDPRILRLVKMARTAIRMSLLLKNTKGKRSILSQEIEEKINKTDMPVFAALFLAVAFGDIQALFSENPNLQRAVELAIPVILAKLMMWKGAENADVLDSDSVERLANFNLDTIAKLEKTFGKDWVKKTIAKMRDEASSENQPNEIDMILTTFGQVLSCLHRFVGRHGTLAAEGENLFGEEEMIAIMFTDVERFAELTRLLGSNIFAILNKYLTAGVEAVEAEGGDVAKFIGDAIFAFFQSGPNNSGSSDQALESAIQIAAIGEKLNDDKEWEELFNNLPDNVRDEAREKFFKLNTRIGLHFGKHFVSDAIGSDSRAAFELIGDDVNLAARMEPLNKIYGTNILMTSEFYKSLSSPWKKRCRLVDRVTVAGREKDPLLIYTVSAKDFSAENERLYRKGFSKYFCGDWAKAREIWLELQNTRAAVNLLPDSVTTAMLARLENVAAYDERALRGLEDRLPDDEEMTAALASIRAALATRPDEDRYQSPQNWDVLRAWAIGK